jgi:xylulokinase
MTFATYLGLDLGTSELKAVLTNEAGQVLAQAGSSVSSYYPFPGASEQAPADWWTACINACAQLRSENAAAMDGVVAIGLSGHMHGATLLDAQGQVLRPCIMWNDTRSVAQCEVLSQQVSELGDITGNLAMPGFTAPKLLWVREHEPAIFAKTAKVLLPKDYLRYLMCGAFVSEMSDAAGTLWLDVGKRDWSDRMLQATGLSREHMPALVEGSGISAHLNAEGAQSLGLKVGIPVAGGAGDNAASAIGMGATKPGDTFISLGTSGVVFTVTHAHKANTNEAVHAFCHAVPGKWHHMAVMLSAASCLRWFDQTSGQSGEAALVAEVESLTEDQLASAPLFLPYLSGERTPHNSAEAAGCFLGLRHTHARAASAYAVMEGVAFGLCDGIAAMRHAGSNPSTALLVGGGSRSAFWAQLLADVLEISVEVSEGAQLGAALGAARLAQLSTLPQPVSEGDLSKVCVRPKVAQTYCPNRARQKVLSKRHELFKQAYKANQSVFSALAAV